MKAHEGAVWSVCVAPDKRGFVTGSADHHVKFWEFELISDEEEKSRYVCHHTCPPVQCYRARDQLRTLK